MKATLSKVALLPIIDGLIKEFIVRIIRTLGVWVLGASIGVFGSSVVKADDSLSSAVSQGINAVADMLAEVYQSFEQLKQDHPEVDLPAPLKEWLAGFSQSPFEHHENISGQLSGVSAGLQYQYSSTELSPEVRQTLLHFVGLIQGIGGELSQAMLGHSHSSVDSALVDVTTLHGREQSEIDRAGMQIASYFRQLDFDGMIKFLNEKKQEFQIP